ncbi:unnamed protein product [Linum tenue]|uniref:TIR domain-containing protein n=1 Tax=Linum tenue TaxID=586396 RepID=A0AAV0IGF9_9ROSI|nr:unnamed protein product [Linum tenue]
MKIDGGRRDRDEDGDELVLSRPAKRQTTLVSEIITRGTTLFHPSNLFLRFLPRFIRPHLFYPPWPPSSRDIVPPSPSSTPSSSSLVLPPKHDVFISFRGSDVRDTFLSHLYSYLERHKKFAVYKDYSDLKRGEEISPSLLDAIERSACYIAIFSPNYADSPWCLDELVRILDCCQRYGRRVVPVFYGGVDPSHVENQTGSYRKLPKGEADGKIRSWRAALTKAAAISGFDSRVTRPESKLIEEICRAVLQALSAQMVPASYSNVGLVGIERRMNEIEQWVTSGSKNLTIGLWGTGGIGKTTLAKAFYDRFSSQFDVFYFWSDFSDQLSASSHLRDGLQNDFFSRLLGDENAGRISRDLKDDRLGRTRALVVIDDVGDDVGDIRHLNNLFNGRYCDLFAPGSIIILTSRNKQVLKNVCHYVYEVSALDKHEALLLFCLSAFKEHCPPIEYEEWSKRALTYAEGNPLALTTLGSHLYGRDQNFWGIELRALERHPNQSLEKVFRRIYDGLGQIEKNVFLDIACLYGRSQVFVKELERLLDGNYVEHGGSENIITKFIDKSMLTAVNVFYNRSVKMHGLLVDLGRSFVNEKLRLEKRSWLFEAQDIYSFFKQGKGSEVTRGIRWDIPRGGSGKEATIHMQSDAFVKLENLRYLVIRQSDRKLVLSKDGLRCLPNSLVILRWDSFPMRCLPYEFCPENLTTLSLLSSNVERLWDDMKNVDLRNLKFLDLSESKYLKKLPDLSTAKRLEKIILSSCVGLVELPLSILHLPKLEVLDLENCTSLELNALGYYTDVNKNDDWATAAIFPKLERLNLRGTSIQNQKLEELEKLTGCGEISANDQELVHLCDLIFQSKALVEIDLSDCIRLKELPEILVPMEALSHLHLYGCTNLSRLPDSISNLVQLKQLSLSCTAIQELPATIGDLACLEELYLPYCTSLKHLCGTIHKLSKLYRLELSGCSQLSHLPELPSSLTWLNAYDCTALQTMSTSGLSKHNFLMCKWNFGNCGKLDSDVCSMLFNKFTQDALGARKKKNRPWLLLPRGWNSRDGWRPSGLNSVVTATLGRLWQLKGLIYCASFHYELVHQPILTTSYAEFRVRCHNLSSTGGGDVITASSSEPVLVYWNNLDSEDNRGSNLLIWYDSEVSWIREVLVPLDSSSAGLEITVTDDATIKFVFQAMGSLFEVPVIVETCGVIPVYDNREMIIDDDDS